VKKPNVRLVKAGISAFDTTGCIDELGERHPVDVIICATGFDTSFIPRFPIVGNQGLNLQKAWEKASSSYFGIGVAGFSNFMMMLGPYSPVANGPTMSGIGEKSHFARQHDTDTAKKHKPITSFA
jgi:cation diffusion facilitator CzcD-associated flavoprotein CzcO